MHCIKFITCLHYIIVLINLMCFKMHKNYKSFFACAFLLDLSLIDKYAH